MISYDMKYYYKLLLEYNNKLLPLDITCIILSYLMNYKIFLGGFLSNMIDTYNTDTIKQKIQSKKLDTVLISNHKLKFDFQIWHATSLNKFSFKFILKKDINLLGIEIDANIGSILCYAKIFKYDGNLIYLLKNSKQIKYSQWKDDRKCCLSFENMSNINDEMKISQIDENLKNSKPFPLLVKKDDNDEMNGKLLKGNESYMLEIFVSDNVPIFRYYLYNRYLINDYFVNWGDWEKRNLMERKFQNVGIFESFEFISGGIVSISKKKQFYKHSNWNYQWYPIIHFILNGFSS